MQITLLDGGMGQELLARTGDKPTPMWSIQVMLDHPGVVQAVHEDYFNAGATVATTNSYMIHHDRLRPADMDHQFTALHLEALAQASAARAKFPGARIAGSLGPLMASYRPDICPPVAEAAPLYAESAALMAPQVDFFICETMASVEQAEGALKGAVTAGKPVWLSITVDDADGNRLRSGEAISDLAPIIAKYLPAAVLVNCSVPEAMSAALSHVAKFGLPFGAYANGFTHISDAFKEARPSVDVLQARHDLTPERYTEFAMGWIGQGATIVGGCCEVGPAHIKTLANALRTAGHQIV